MGEEPVAPAAEAQGFGEPYRMAYQLGIYQAVSAIPDAYLVVDGPDCVIRKAEYVHGKHDWRSTLLDVAGEHRLASTLLNDDGVITSNGEVLADRLRRIGELGRAGVILVTAMPHVALIGTDYDLIAHREQAAIGAPILQVPSLAMEGDWFDGYADTLGTLAQRLELPRARTAPDRVAIVGHLMHRVEDDCRADAAELRRLVEALGLEVASVWLDGAADVLDLTRAATAGTLVALPLGRQAARHLAARTGATVVEVEEPIGLQATCAFLAAVGAATGREALAEAFVHRELVARAPRLEFALEHVFVGRRVAFSGSPHHFAGFADLAGELGLRVVHLSAPCRDGHVPLEALRARLGRGARVLVALDRPGLGREATRMAAEGVDLIVGNTVFQDATAQLDAARVELGFPSHFDHALHDRPILGFAGWSCLVDRMANALLSARRHAGA